MLATFGTWQDAKKVLVSYGYENVVSHRVK